MVKSKVFSIIALKGGVGKTTLVANLGAALCDEYKKRVLIIDANFSTPHLGLHVGLINPEKNLHPALMDHYPINEAIYEHPTGFHIIPGKLAPQLIDFSSLRNKIESLKESYDYILIDSSPSLNHEMLAAMEASDEIIVVSSPDYPTLSSTLHAIRIARENGIQIKGLVLNKVRKKSFELKTKEISGASETNILVSIPDDVNVQSSLAKMSPVVINAPKSEASHSIKQLAGSLVGQKYKKRGILGGISKRLKIKRD
jgi:septum site-determining protein MinD